MCIAICIYTSIDCMCVAIRIIIIQQTTLVYSPSITILPDQSINFSCKRFVNPYKAVLPSLMVYPAWLLQQQMVCPHLTTVTKLYLILTTSSPQLQALSEPLAHNACQIITHFSLATQLAKDCTVITHQHRIMMLYISLEQPGGGGNLQPPMIFSKYYCVSSNKYAYATMYIATQLVS